VNRRALLKLAALAGASAAFRWPAFGQAGLGPDGRGLILRYLETLARADGGYGWEGQGHSHLTATFHVIGSYQALGALPGQARVAEFVRTHHPGALKKLEQERRLFEWQQAQALTWLGANAAEVKTRVLSWKQPLAYLKQYEQHGYPLFSSEMGVILARALLGVPAQDLPVEFVAYLDSRRRTNGSFNNTPASDGSDGHVLSTWWGLQALQTLDRAKERRDDTIAWLKACQLPNGGFGPAPKPALGGVDDVAYTRAAVCALKHLGAGPEKALECVRYLRSLANADGGFADRPGWLSNPMATHYALEALAALGELDSLRSLARRPAITRPSLPAGLKVFSIQLEAHGHGSPAEAVELARSLRLHLWGAKNAKPAWLARCQAIASDRKVPVQFFVSDEEYGTWVDVPGLGTYSHTSDIIAPVGQPIGPALSNQGAVSWPEFRTRRWSALEKAGGRLIWQFGENEELVRLLLDDSLARGGFAAISTYHFGNPDFTNSEPFLHRWRGQLPFVALQDAHGPEPWWFADMTTGFRTVFLGTEPTWQAWLRALQQNWVAAIRHDTWSGGNTWMHAGSREVTEFVQAHERDWRWWDNPGLERPLVSLVVVRPEDQFETARPDKGVTLRVRCAWENTLQGLLKQPISEFVKLVVDGKAVAPALISRKRPNGLLEEHCHQLPLPELSSGPHTATVTARVLATGAEVQRTVDFS